MDPADEMISLGNGAQVRRGEVASFHPAILHWMEAGADSPYDIPAKAAARTVIVLRNGLKLPCRLRARTFAARLRGEAASAPEDPERRTTDGHL